MEGVAAGAQVGAGQPHEAQLCAIGAASDGLHHRRQPHRFRSGLGVVDELEVLLDDLRHILVLILDAPLHRTGAVPFVQHLGRVEHRLLPHLQAGGTVVTEDIMQLRLAHIAGHLGQVIEPFVALGELRALGSGQQPLQFARHVDGVDHLRLGVARVDVAALNLDLRARGVEVLVFQFAFHAAVNGVGEIGAEGFHVEEIHAPAHLLVGREADADLAVFHLGVRQQIFRGGHDFRHARLVVGAQQRRAVGVDQRVPLEEGQLRELRNLHRQLAVQGDVAAVVLLDHAGFHLLAAHVRRGVHVGDEADHGGVPASRRGRDRAHHVAVLVHRHLGHAEGLHLVAQDRQKDLLLLGRGECRAVFVRLRVVRYVFQKTFFEFHNFNRLKVKN